MRKRVNKIFWLLVFFLVFLIFCSWFGLKEISSGDAGFYFEEALKSFPGFPYLWFSHGLGHYSSLLSSFPYLVLPLKILSFLGLSWVLIERVAWYGPFLGLSIFSSWYLLKTVLPEVKFRFLAPLVYLFNTYILMIVGGGQVSIFLAYAIAPLVLGLFIKKGLILAGVALAVQVCFEPRIAFITLAAIVIYQLLNAHFAGFLRNDGLRVTNWVRNLGVPLLIVGLLHFYWILPSLILRKTSFSLTLVSGGWVDFLSFADFSDSLSLLHPNWPENIFGKTYFFRPEFLIIPILVFSSLLFLTNQRMNILFFSSLALIGAFLAKGTNPPFGEVYLWLFNNIPGMNLFRDPTKFYFLVALSYSILIPFSVENIYARLKPRWRNLFLLLIIGCLLFLIRPAWLGQLGGTFKAKGTPPEYVVLKDFINNQDKFFRTIWVPKKQRLGFFSNNHPAISAENFLTDFPFTSEESFGHLGGVLGLTEMPERWGQDCPTNDRCYVRELSYFLNPQTAQILAQMAVKYVIVPFDSEGEIFIAEHQYNHQQREEVEEFLDTISWLKKVRVADKIAVYELPEFKDHFLGISEEMVEIQWQMINPTKYKVQVKNTNQTFKLVFSETYDELWQAKLGGETIFSQPHMGILNSFLINKTGDFEAVVELAGQKFVYYGLGVSLLTFLTSLGVLAYYWLKK